MIAAIIPSPDALMTEVVSAALENNMHIITDGFRVVVSPIVPPGWHRMGVTVRDQPITQETPRCVA